MIIEVKVKILSKNSSVKKIDNIYHVALKSKPVQNSANIELIDILASYFNVPKSSVNILRGQKSKQKLIRIDGR